MSRSEPRLSRLNAIGIAIEDIVRKCDASFQKQLDLCPNSIQTLRRYAQFQVEVSRRVAGLCGCDCVFVCSEVMVW